MEITSLKFETLFRMNIQIRICGGEKERESFEQIQFDSLRFDPQVSDRPTITNAIRQVSLVSKL